ncbi:MAG: diguanylate cyclase [Spirochaetaceae bacterium]
MSDQEILIVDDIPKNLQVIASHLVNEPYELIMATSGKSAIAAMEDSIPDLVLLDISMPDMNGYEVCEYIKRDQRLKNIPVIFLTAFSDVENVVKGFEVGGIDYIKKPFHQAELKIRIKTHLELHKLKKDLLRCSITDPLTRIDNRRGIVDKLEVEYHRLSRGGTEGYLMLGDIDDFKVINDTYGHDYGDYVLQSIAAIIRENIRSEDLFGRWGGEEFLLYFPQIKKEGALDVGEKIRHTIENYIFEFNNHKHKVTMTFGISILTEKDKLEAAIKRCDIGLYDGKETGKNRVIFK